MAFHDTAGVDRVGAVPPCRHCGGALQLLNVIPRLGARPRYRIYGCEACKKIEWIEG